MFLMEACLLFGSAGFEVNLFATANRLQKIKLQSPLRHDSAPTIVDKDAQNGIHGQKFPFGIVSFEVFDNLNRAALLREFRNRP